MLDRRIYNLLDRFSKNLGHDWNVQEMSNEFGLSSPHFQKLFKREVGMPPMTYLRNLRLEKVSELLLATYDPIKLIGIQTGMKSDSHLTREFKNRFGLTPTEYRIHHAEIEQSVSPDEQE